MDETLPISEERMLLERGIERLNSGDTSVRGELLNIACQRLKRLTHRIGRDFDGLGGAHSSGDTFDNASLRLYEALYDTPIDGVRHFYHLAAIEIRRELATLCKGGEVCDLNLTERISLDQWSHWATFHDSVNALPEREREIFDLIWYHEMTRGEAADLLGVPLAEVRRLWRAARLNLHQRLDDTV